MGSGVACRSERACSSCGKYSNSNAGKSNWTDYLRAVKELCQISVFFPLPRIGFAGLHFIFCLQNWRMIGKTLFWNSLPYLLEVADYIHNGIFKCFWDKFLFDFVLTLVQCFSWASFFFFFFLCFIIGIMLPMWNSARWADRVCQSFWFA